MNASLNEKLGTVKWGEFKLGDLFEVVSYKKCFDANKVAIIENRGHPYIVRQSTENGRKGNIDEPIKYLNPGNTISFGQDTATMFYQEKPYFTGDKIKILRPKYAKFGKNNAQFFLSTMRKAFCSFAWGSSRFNVETLKKQTLLMQAKLLRVLQEQELLRVGGTAPIKINVRVISATNRDLKQMIREQTFREDLFYRLSVVSLEIPPLRERRNDIFPLIQHFITELNNKYGFHKTLTPDAFQVLKSYSFPGNVRELKNCLEEAVVMSEDDRLTRDSFSCLLQGHIVPCADGERPLDDILLDIEYQYLTNALQEEGSIRKAAARLQMSSTTFARRLKQAEERLHL